LAVQAQRFKPPPLVEVMTFGGVHSSLQRSSTSLDHSAAMDFGHYQRFPKRISGYAPETNAEGIGEKSHAAHRAHRFASAKRQTCPALQMPAGLQGNPTEG
ncbi:hypothetical protein ACFOVS_08880, partial [Rhizobium lemnae]